MTFFIPYALIASQLISAVPPSALFTESLFSDAEKENPIKTPMSKPNPVSVQQTPIAIESVVEKPATSRPAVPPRARTAAAATKAQGQAAEAEAPAPTPKKLQPTNPFADFLTGPVTPAPVASVRCVQDAPAAAVERSIVSSREPEPTATVTAPSIDVSIIDAAASDLAPMSAEPTHAAPAVQSDAVPDAPPVKPPRRAKKRAAESVDLTEEIESKRARDVKVAPVQQAEVEMRPRAGTGSGVSRPATVARAMSTWMKDPREIQTRKRPDEDEIERQTKVRSHTGLGK